MEQLKIYTEKGCQRCKEVISYLKDNNVVFEEIKLLKGERPDIYEVPMICLKDKCVVGVDKNGIEKLLKEKIEENK